MIIELGVCTFSILLVSNSLKKYMTKHNKITAEIIFIFCGFFVSSFLTGFGKLLIISGVSNYQIIQHVFFIDNFALMSLIIANTAFFLFTLDVFYNIEANKKRDLIIAYISIESVLLVIGIIILLSGITSKLATIGVLGSFFVLFIFTYVLLTIKAFNVARKALPGLDKISMQLIILSGFLIIGFFLLFGLDVLNLFGLGNISAFYFMSWSVAAVAMFVTYLGYFRPAWFLKRFKMQDESKKSD